MVGHTVVEIIGHIFYSFTRSVAEHYDYDEAEQNSHLIGYNPLDDTGLEWYCQPVDDLIYQEYSNSEATKFDYLASSRVEARFIDACSTEEHDESNQEVTEDRAMAWKRLRPSIFRSIWKSFYFGFLMSVLSATLVGIVSIVIYYLSYQTLLKCESFSTKSIPEKLQWMRTVSEVVVCSAYFYWFFLNTLFYFRSFQISGIKLKLCLLCLAFYIIDAVYRICFQDFGFTRTKLTPIQKIPLIALFSLCVCLQVSVIVRHLSRGPRKVQFRMFLLTTIPCVLTYFTAVVIAYIIYPAYRGEDKNGKMVIAIFTPLIALVVKGVSRVCVQRLSRISHPGTSYVLLVPMYCGAAVMLRLLQVDLGINLKFEKVVIIGMIHGIAEVVERSTMVLIDHITHQVLERRKVPWGGFRTPRRERLAADINILSMLYESSAIISVNGFLYLYQYFYTSDKSPLQLLQLFAITTSVPLAIEWFFTSVSIAIETRFQNMPIIAVWRKTWKRHLLVAVINMVVITVYGCTYLFIAIKPSTRLAHTDNYNCDMPFTRL
ncbi:hypothetical protein ACROYT_G044405 [Oculina patagonica]